MAVAIRKSDENALEKLRDATRMLGEVRTSREAKTLMDKAAAAEYYAQKAKLGEEAILYAHTIKIEASALLGGYLKTEAKQAGARGRQASGSSRGSLKELHDAPPTLAELGLTKKESMQAQHLYSIKEKAPDEFTAIRDGKKTLAQAYRAITPPAHKENPKWDFADGSDRIRKAVDREIALAGEKELPRIVYALRCVINEIGGRNL